MPPTLTAPNEPPPQGDRLKAGDTKGHLLIVCPIRLHAGFFPGKTPQDSASDAIEVDVVDLDQAENGAPGHVFHRIMWGGVLIAPALAQQCGATILARMGEGVARGANNAPFKLIDATGDPQAVARAQEFFARRPGWRAEEPAAPPAPPNGQAPYQWPAGAQAAPPAAPYGPPQGQPYPPQGQPPPGPYGPPQQPYGPPPGYPPAPYGQQPAPYGPPPGFQPGQPPSAEAQALYAGQFPQQPYPGGQQ